MKRRGHAGNNMDESQVCAFKVTVKQSKNMEACMEYVHMKEKVGYSVATFSTFDV